MFPVGSKDLLSSTLATRLSFLLRLPCALSPLVFQVAKSRWANF